MAWGDGSIYRRKDGRWCGQLSVGGRRFYVYGRTRREAEDKLAAAAGAGQAGGALLEGRRPHGLRPAGGVRFARGRAGASGQGTTTRRLADSMLRDLGKEDQASCAWTPSRLEALFAESGEMGSKAVWDCLPGPAALPSI
jgi:hypothetical protein